MAALACPVFSAFLGLTVTSVLAQIRLESAQRLEITNIISIAYPVNWSVAPGVVVGLMEIINVPADRQHVQAATAAIKMTTEKRTSHDEAVLRLAQIAEGYGAPASAFLQIGRWPALQYTRVEDRPQPSQGPQFDDPRVFRVTTAVAVGDLLARVEAYLPSKSDDRDVSEAQEIGRSLSFTTQGEAAQVQAEIEGLRTRIHVPSDCSL